MNLPCHISEIPGASSSYPEDDSEKSEAYLRLDRIRIIRIRKRQKADYEKRLLNLNNNLNGKSRVTNH